MRKILKNIFAILMLIFFITGTNSFAVTAPKGPVKTIVQKKVTVTVQKKAEANSLESNDDNTKKQPKQVKPAKLPKFDQFSPLTKGDEVAVIRTNMGVIIIKLLPQYAPKAVEIFKSNVINGFYDGLNFNRVVSNLSIQGGILEQPDMLSEPVPSNDNINELDEFNPNVRNFRGAVSMAIPDSGKPGQQFTIVQAGSDYIDEEPLNYMQSSGDKLFPKYVIDKYKSVGGAPMLDYHNVVFGQVIQGMNIVDKISRVRVDENYMPKKAVKIIRVEIMISK